MSVLVGLNPVPIILVLTPPADGPAIGIVLWIFRSKVNVKSRLPLKSWPFRAISSFTGAVTFPLRSHKGVLHWIALAYPMLTGYLSMKPEVYLAWPSSLLKRQEMLEYFFSLSIGFILKSVIM